MTTGISKLYGAPLRLRGRADHRDENDELCMHSPTNLGDEDGIFVAVLIFFVYAL